MFGFQISISNQIQRAKANHARIMRENAKESLNWEFVNLCNSAKEGKAPLSSLARPWQDWVSRRLVGSKLSPPASGFSYPESSISHLDFRLDYNLWWVLGAWELQLHPLFDCCIFVCSVSYVHCMSCPVLRISKSCLCWSMYDCVSNSIFWGSKWSQKWPILM